MSVLRQYPCITYLLLLSFIMLLLIPVSFSSIISKQLQIASDPFF